MKRTASWLQRDLEEQARIYAITELVPRHLEEVKQRREAQIDKTMAAVNERLTSEITTGTIAPRSFRPGGPGRPTPV